jgi:nucleotide-binding universal stress UspA family protein
MTPKRILVAMDFSSDSNAALAYALELARPLQASIDLLHVVETPLAAGMWASEIYTTEIAGLQVNLVRDAENQMRQTIRSLDRGGVAVTGEVRTGRAAATIVDCARENAIDLVVMATHGRTGFARALMGSVAEGVTRAAPCPVLVVRPSQTGRLAEAAVVSDEVFV